MKRLSIYFLALSTFWVSTWMVIDIHDWANGDANHDYPVFVEQHAFSGAEIQSQIHEDHNPQCGQVCSYDHGGHMGQTLTTPHFVSASIPQQNIIHSPISSDSWHSRKTTPNLPPPIV